jgi:SPP1 family predicted phage head-tail adaptor
MRELGAGDLRERISFQRRVSVDDGWGNTSGAGEFETQFTVWANLRPLRGNETVMAARLEGRQPHILTVRQSSDTRRITTAWQAVDARNPTRVFAVTAPPADPTGKRQWLEILVTEGAVS